MSSKIRWNEGQKLIWKKGTKPQDLPPIVRFHSVAAGGDHRIFLFPDCGTIGCKAAGKCGTWQAADLEVYRG